MKTSDFDYDLPQNLIAQTPLLNRTESRCLFVNRTKQNYLDGSFEQLLDYLTDDDVLVMNNTKVLPARLFGIKQETGACVECLILKIDGQTMECLCGNARVIKVGSVIVFDDNLLKATCYKIGEEGIRYFNLEYSGIIYEILDKLGQMPLPPYIHQYLEDKQRYQTVYAKVEGSAAAPTAGLHFTEEFLNKIKTKGVKIVEITLHVGLGTFRPVKVDDVNNHKMHSEEYFVDEESAMILNQAKKSNKRIISVGTTTTRVLETQMLRYNEFRCEHSHSDIFIYPGFQFKAIDGLITNFHLPKSTLLMLVSAFSSRDFMLECYKHAVESQYRFFSFGDCMFIYG